MHAIPNPITKKKTYIYTQIFKFKALHCRSIMRERERERDQVRERLELDEIMGGMGSDDEVIRRLQLNVSPEVIESERDGVAKIHVAWISKQSNSSISLVLYHFFVILTF